MDQTNMNLGVFHETKVTSGIYMRGLSGYNVIAAYAQSRCQGEIAVFHRDSTVFKIEEQQNFRPNFVSFQIAFKGRRWYIMG